MRLAWTACRARRRLTRTHPPPNSNNAPPPSRLNRLNPGPGWPASATDAGGWVAASAFEAETASAGAGAPAFGAAGTDSTGVLEGGERTSSPGVLLPGCGAGCVSLT